MSTAIKLIIYASLVILGLAVLLWSQKDSIIHPTFVDRIAAGVLLLAIIVDCVVELGWLGGDKNA